MEMLSLFDGSGPTTPFIYRESMLVSNGVVKGVVIKGVDFKRLSSVSNISIKRFGGVAGSVFLGTALAAKLGITGPSSINILTGSDKFQKLNISGTFESGLYDYDSQFVLMPIPNVQQLFDMKDGVTGIEITATDPDMAPVVADMFGAEFPYPYQVTHWAELNRPIFEAIHLEKIMFAVIIGTLVLVAMFNIIGMLVLRVLYKVKDIAILAAIGMKGISIRAIFTFHATMLGIFGTLIGLMGGVAASIAIGRFRLVDIEPEIYFLSSLPIKIEWDVVAIIGLAGVLVSLLVSTVASWQVASVNVSEGLR